MKKEAEAYLHRPQQVAPPPRLQNPRSDLKEHREYDRPPDHARETMGKIRQTQIDQHVGERTRSEHIRKPLQPARTENPSTYALRNLLRGRSLLIQLARDLVRGESNREKMAARCDS